MTNYLTSVGVQQFSITIASGNTTGTATINAVGSGAFILFGGVNPSIATNPAEDYTRLTLTNSTTITATRNTGTSGTVVVTGCIVDGDTTNLIKSVQFGTVTIANAASSGTASVTAITDANAAIHLLGWSSANTSYSGINENPVLTQSGTTVTATRQGTTGALVVGFVLIEFQGSVLNQSVQRISATSSASVTSFTAAVTSVNTANTICILAGSQIATVTSPLSNIKQYGSLTNSTTFTVNVNTASANAKTYNASIVEFAAGVLNSSVQRGTTALAAVASNTSAITSVNASYSLLSWLGNITSAGGTSMAQGECEAALTNGTTVTVTKNNAVTTNTGSWEVAEFPAFSSGTRVFDFMGFF